MRKIKFTNFTSSLALVFTLVLVVVGLSCFNKAWATPPLMKAKVFTSPQDSGLNIYFIGTGAKLLFDLLRKGTRSIAIPNGIFLAGEEAACSQTFDLQFQILEICSFHLGKRGIENSLTPPFDPTFPLSLNFDENNFQLQNFSDLGLIKIEIFGKLAETSFHTLQDIPVEDGIKRGDNLICQLDKKCEFLINERGVIQESL